MRKLVIAFCIVLLMSFVGTGVAISSGFIRIIIPASTDVDSFNLQEGELAYDQSEQRVLIYGDSSFGYLVPTLVEELPTMTDMAGQKLIVAKVVIDGNPLGKMLLKEKFAYPYYGKTKKKVDWCLL